MEVKWYIANVIPGREESAKKAIGESIGIGDDRLVKDILIPVEDGFRVRAGKKMPVRKKVLPGYMMVKIGASEFKEVKEILGRLRSVNGVLGILGGLDNPSVVPESEVLRIMEVEKSSVANQANDGGNISDFYEVGNNIKICDGVFDGFNAVVSEVDNINKRLKVIVSIFERDMPVALSFSQVLKMDERD